MSIFDLFALIVVGLMFLLGFRRGFVSQVIGIASLIGAIIVSGLWGVALGNTLFARLGGELASFLGIALLIVIGYVVVRVVLEMLFGSIGRRPDGTLKGWNRFLGAMLRVVEGGAGYLILLWVLCLFTPELENSAPKLVESMNSSYAVRLARFTSPFSREQVQSAIKQKVEEALGGSEE